MSDDQWACALLVADLMGGFHHTRPIKRFTEEEARKVEKVRPPEDKAWPVDYVLARTRRAVSQGDLYREEG